ncbi:MAG: hypothetical protein JW940_36000 [Polyangiaceae bacterium]|nr:hypothetical protein [Polyangiaceae bacterium]
MDRRTFIRALVLAGAGGFGPRTVRATVPERTVLEERELTVEGDRRLAHRALLLLPRKRPADAQLPLLVLLHGLGETGNEQLGIRAWVDRYGLASCYDRLVHAPVSRTLEHRNYLSDEHVRSLNQALHKQPFSGMALLCPFTPNVYRMPSRQQAVDRYAEWLETRLLPAVRARAPVSSDRKCTAIDGCSLGGYLSLEVFLRKPHLFGALGAVQGAIGASTAPKYAERVAKVLQRREPIATAIRLGTSTGDPYRKPNERLSAELLARGLENTLEVLPGPHNQPWLREIGTLSMLLWHDRAFARRGCGVR